MVARPRDLELDDAALVSAAQAGDPEAFSELFRRHYSPVKRVVARRLGNLRDADEIAQAAFVRAYERIDRCGGDRRFGAWVQVIANNLAVDHLRAQNRTQPVEEPVQGDAALGPNAPEDALLQREQAELVRRALDTLPDRQRDVVVARDVDGRRPPEIAAAMGLTLGAVDSILLRARRRLADTVNSMAAETGATSVATTSMVTATGAVMGSTTIQRALLAVGEFVSRASFQVAASMGMVPGSDSVGSHAAQVAAAGLLSFVPLGGDSGEIAVPEATSLPAVTATVDAVGQIVPGAAPAQPADPTAGAPPAAVPTAPPMEGTAPPAAPSAPPAEPAPEQESLIKATVRDTVEAVESVVGLTVGL